MTAPTTPTDDDAAPAPADMTAEQAQALLDSTGREQWTDGQGRTRYGPAPSTAPPPRHTFVLSGWTEHDTYWELELVCKRTVSAEGLAHLRSIPQAEKNGMVGIMHMARTVLLPDSVAKLAVFDPDHPDHDPDDGRVLDMTDVALAMRDAYSAVTGIALGTAANPDPSSGESGTSQPGSPDTTTTSEAG